VRTGTGLPRLVVGIEQLAGVDRQTAAADAGREPVADRLERRDAVVNVLAPALGQPLPVAAVRGPVRRQGGKGRADPVERYTRRAAGLDQRDPPQHGSLVAALVPGRSLRDDQPFTFVETERRRCHAAAGCNLADRQLSGHLLT
jgi:hypothetical protein